MCENTIELSSVIGLVLRLMLADDLAGVDVMNLTQIYLLTKEVEERPRERLLNSLRVV